MTCITYYVTHITLGAHSFEFDPASKHPVVIFMPEMSKTHLGGTMRLGARPTSFVEKHKSSSKAFALYGKQDTISERHRHRYEVNPEYIERLENAGLHFVGQDEKFERMEIIEMADHPFFVASQYHPEYKSRPLSPSPLFLGFVLASGGLYSKYAAQMTNKENGVASPIHERVVEDDAETHLGKYTHATRCDSPFVKET
jgi:CTP synthase